jgi:hypothetical protein
MLANVPIDILDGTEGELRGFSAKYIEHGSHRTYYYVCHLWMGNMDVNIRYCLN